MNVRTAMLPSGSPIVLKLARPKHRIAICIVLLGASVAYLFSRENCCSIDSKLLLASAVIQPINLLVLATVAFRFVLLAREPRPQFWACFKASVLATGINILAPARGGDLIRLTYLRQSEGIPLGVGISISFIERISDLVVLCGMAIVLVSFALLQSQITLPIGIIVAAAMGTAAVSFGLPYLTVALRRFLPALTAEFLISIAEEIVARIRDGKIFVALAASTVFLGLGLLATMIFFQIATGREFSLALATLVLVLATLGGAIPILPGGLATFEAGVIAALLFGGFSAGEALQLAVVYRLQQFAIATPIALTIVSRERLGISSMLSEIYGLLLARRGTGRNQALPVQTGADTRNPSPPAV